MTYRDDLEALRTRHDQLAAELGELRRESKRLEEASERAAKLEDEVADMRERLESMHKQRRLPLLDDVRVASPCSESWDEMVGDERARFCLKCEKNVYDVSAMTRDEAESLIARAEGSSGLCLRLYRRKDGTILTADCPVGKRRRRVTRIAAAALAVGGAAAAIAGVGRSVAVMGEMDIVVPQIEAPTPFETEEEIEPETGKMMMGDVIALPPKQHDSPAGW